MKKNVLLLLFLASTILSAQITQIGTAINGAEFNNQAGASLSFNIDGSVLAVGYLRTLPIFEDRGMARVFEKINNEWIQKGSDLGNQGTDDRGSHVSLNGDGSVLAMSTGSPVGGHNSNVTIYEFINNDWQLKGNPIDLRDRIAKLNEQGNIVVISDPNPIAATVIYEYINNDWQLIASIENNAALNGIGVDINAEGSIIALLNFSGSSNNWERIHFVEIYKNINDNWTQIGSIEKLSKETIIVAFDLNKTGDVIIISSVREDEDEIPFSETKVYKYENEIWEQIGNTILLSPTDDFHRIESIVKINDTGDIIAIGNPFENGAVKLYKLNNNNWFQLGEVIGDGGDFGRAISFSEDATMLAVGAPTYSEVGFKFGQVTTYEINYELFGLDYISKTTNLLVYPNPVKNILNIEAQNGINIKHITVYDLLERQLMYKEKPNHQLNISNLNKGILIVKIKTNEGVSVKKIIKN